MPAQARNSRAGDDAAGLSVSESADIPAPRVVFENEEKESPDLYITKHVENAVGGYQAPEDDEFYFILKINGKLAVNEPYQLLDSNNNLIEKADKSPYTTSSSGIFILKAEQTARFEYVGTGVSYEVTELPKDDYLQTIPAGGLPATGTVNSNGEVVEFTNLYNPKGTGTVTKLVVQKMISFPDGYTAPESPDFPFVLELDGKVYGNEPYTITDNKTGNTLGDSSTGADGSFTLKGGTSAVFDNIPVDVDYKVYEVTDEETGALMVSGWRATGETLKEGATQAPETRAIFNNVNASFAVTKSLSDNSKPDVSFDFLLTTKDYYVWKGAEYYLYKTASGEQVDKEIHRTNDQGIFSLQPGQMAIFIGIEPGTLYNVSEVGNPSYIQKIPSSVEGYINKEVKTSVEVLPFVNEPADSQSLNITKRVENTTQEAPFDQNEEFSFKLYQEVKSGEDSTTVEYKLVTDKAYSIQAGNSVNTYSPDKETGIFTIKANETARFDSLPLGEYWVVEISKGMDSEYQPNLEDSNIAAEIPSNSPFHDEKYVQKGTLSRNATLNFVFTNLYAPKLWDLVLVKKDGTDNSLLKGAEFMLYRDEELTNSVETKINSNTNEGPESSTDGTTTESSTEVTNIYRTGDDGKVTIQGLKTGTYWLVEVKSPSGYTLLADPIKIELKKDAKANGNEFSVILDDDKADNKIVSVGEVKSPTSENANVQVELTVFNNELYELPSTGGMGIHWYWIGGTLLMVAAILILNKNKYMKS